MNMPALDVNLTTLEHAHMCLHEAFLQSQPTLSEALRLLLPAHEVKSRLDPKMRSHFVEVRLCSWRGWLHVEWNCASV